MGYDIRYIGQSEREMAAWIHECESSNKNGPLACTPFEEDQNKRKFNPNADEITKQEITKDMKMFFKLFDQHGGWTGQNVHTDEEKMPS